MARAGPDSRQAGLAGANVVYAPLRPGVEGEIIHFLLEHFCPRAPVTVGLHMVGQDNLEWLRLGMPGWLASGVGVVARDAASGEMAGCVVSKILTKQDSTTFDMEDSITNGKAKKLLGMASELEAAVDLFQHYSAERGLELAMVTVATKHGGRGVGRRLVEESERLAQARGCQFSVAQATSSISQRIFDKLSYETLHELRYEGYAYKGTVLDTAKMAPHTSAKVMARRLAAK